MNRTRPYPHYKFPDEITIEAKLLPENECKWFGVPIDSYALRCTNYGWFPTEVITTVQKGKYVDGHNIGVTITGNMGSASIAVKDVPAAIKMLSAAGYNVNLIN